MDTAFEVRLIKRKCHLPNKILPDLLIDFDNEQRFLLITN
jgi:hypothetical protein